MTNEDYPWEPPLSGPEAPQLLGALDRLRATFRWKADGLDANALAVRIGASALSIGSLLKHLAACEDAMFTMKMTGEPIGEPWTAKGFDPDGSWALTFDATESPEELYELWDGAVARSHQRLSAKLAGGGLDQPVHLAWPGRGNLSLRRLLCDLLEEYGRHTGHADLIREAIDGVVGEDVPPGWHPKSGPAGRSPFPWHPSRPHPTPGAGEAA